MPQYNVPYRGELVGTRIKILQQTPTYGDASTDNLNGYLASGTYMIMSYLDSDPAKSTQPIFLIVADPQKNLYIIAKDDSGTNYRYLSNAIYYVIGGLVAIGLFFAFGKKRRRVSHG